MNGYGARKEKHKFHKNTSFKKTNIVVVAIKVDLFGCGVKVVIQQLSNLIMDHNKAIYQLLGYCGLMLGWKETEILIRFNKISDIYQIKPLLLETSYTCGFFFRKTWNPPLC